MRVEITIQEESGDRTSATLDSKTPTIVVGRHGSCDLQSLSRSVSRRHAELSWDGDTLIVTDLESTGGTFLNDKKVERAEVGLGDDVRCGKVELSIKFVGHNEKPATSSQGNTLVLEAYAPKEEVVHGAKAAPPMSQQERTRREQDPTLRPGDISAVDMAELRASTGQDKGGALPPESPSPTQMVETATPTSSAPANRPVAETSKPRAGEKKPPRPPTSEPVMGYGLAYTETDGKTHTIFVPMDASGFVIGRGRQAAGVVRHSTVSRKHCELTCNGSSLYVRDLGSSTGTRINGHRVRDGQLQQGDILTLGKLELTMGMHYLEQNSGDEEEDGPWALSFTDPDGVTHTFHVSDEGLSLVVGRSKKADVTLPATTVGRRHCEIRLSGDRLFVKDLESRNGTFVNDRQVREKSLKPGDIIKCGAFPIEVLGPQRQGAILDWEAGWDDEWTDEDLTPPIWHLIYLGDEGQVEHETLGPTRRSVAIGSDKACDIHSKTRELDPDHCEIIWEEGTPVAKDLESHAGTSLRGRRIREHVLKNADILSCGALHIHIIRGRTGDGTEQTAQRPAAAKEWAENFKLKDSSCCLVYSYGDEDDPSFRSIGKTELTVWVDGEAAAERTTQEGVVKATGTIQSATVDLLLTSLRRAGYPVIHHPYEPEEGCPVELAAYQGDEEVSVLLGRHAMNRSENYREAIELLRAFSFELIAATEMPLTSGDANA